MYLMACRANQLATMCTMYDAKQCAQWLPTIKNGRVKKPIWFDVSTGSQQPSR
jgi:hypothetical protein